MNKQELYQSLGDRRDWDGLNALEESEDFVTQTFVDTKTPGQRIYEAFSACATLPPPLDMPWHDLPTYIREAWEFAANDLLKSYLE